MRDDFPKVGRWESVGLSCGVCAQLVAPDAWPDVSRSIRCALHGVSLAIELGPDGFVDGEWFCSAFEDPGVVVQPSLFSRLFGDRPHTVTSREALEHLDSIRQELDPSTLYRFVGRGELESHALSELSGER